MSAKRKASPCISYRPGEPPSVFTPEPKAEKRRAKKDEVAERLLRRIEDYRTKPPGVI